MAGSKQPAAGTDHTTTRMLLWTVISVFAFVIGVLGIQSYLASDSGGGTADSTNSGTTVETRPVPFSDPDGRSLGDADFSLEDGYCTIAQGDKAIVVYDASELDAVFDEAASDVSLSDLDAAVDANDNLPADFKAVAHDFCAALVSGHPNADLRVLLHNLERLSVTYEGYDSLEEESSSKDVGGYFDRSEHKIALPQDLDFASDAWARETAYHELGHAARQYYEKREDGTQVYVRFDGPDDTTDALSEALDSLLAVSLMDERPTDTSYQLTSNYVRAMMDALDGYTFDDYLAHSSQWLARKLDERLGENGGQLLLELLQLQKDDESDGRTNLSPEATNALVDRMSELYLGERISTGMTYQQAEAAADELVATLSEGFDDADDAVDASRVRYDLRKRCRELGIADVPEEPQSQEDALEETQDASPTAPDGVSYLASFKDEPLATYRVIAHGRTDGGTRPDEYLDEAALDNNELGDGEGQYLALYQGGTCRLFETSDDETADVSIGYWDANEAGELRNFTLSDAYYDEGVLQGEDGLTFATGSSGKTMLLVPSDYDVRHLKPYHLATRTRDEGYRERSAFDGGWTFEALEPAEWMYPSEDDQAYPEYLEDLAAYEEAAGDLARALEATIAAGGYQRLYIGGNWVWRMASDGTLVTNVAEGRFQVSSLAVGSSQGVAGQSNNPLAFDDGDAHRFELKDANTLVEYHGNLKVTYRRDPCVREPDEQDNVGPTMTRASGEHVRRRMGSIALFLPAGYAHHATTDYGTLYESPDESVTVYVCEALPLPSDDVTEAEMTLNRNSFEGGIRGTWEPDWDPEVVEVEGAGVAVRGEGTRTYKVGGLSERYHALLLRVDGYNYYVYACERTRREEDGTAAFAHDAELERMLDSVSVTEEGSI